MDRWLGYLPVSSVSLLATFERAARSGVQFSLAERALFMACEFWTAVSARKLIAHVGADSIDVLRYMRIIYSGVGAQDIAGTMIGAIGELEATSHPHARHSCLTALQERLLRTGDPVDQLIARFTETLGLGAAGGANWVRTSERAVLAG